MVSQTAATPSTSSTPPSRPHSRRKLVLSRSNMDPDRAMDTLALIPSLWENFENATRSKPQTCHITIHESDEKLLIFRAYRQDPGLTLSSGGNA
ncbi:unnamed protein product, partial [Cylicostephanus goldi]